MFAKLPLVVTLFVLLTLPFSNAANAGVGYNMGGVADLLKGASPIEKSQYYSFDDDDYCWYDEGWEGPGWYWCGYEWESGLGWGGPYGWNGWGGGASIRPRRPHGIGIWHPESPNDRRVGGAGWPSPLPERHLGGVPEVRAPGAGGGVPPSFHFGGARTVHNFGGVAPPTVHGFGAGGSHGGFGGGPSFPGGGHGGGHR